jgi:hypothetical protein
MLHELPDSNSAVQVLEAIERRRVGESFAGANFTLATPLASAEARGLPPEAGLLLRLDLGPPRREAMIRTAGIAGILVGLALLLSLAAGALSRAYALERASAKPPTIDPRHGLTADDLPAAQAAEIEQITEALADAAASLAVLSVSDAAEPIEPKPSDLAAASASAASSAGSANRSN